mmetsp:Transcript_5939/g.12421  ORF Transcript_5939/g.12421 Transcript_5939/m.12421 type:complete len:223 (-) Transcript_5939:2153-2821(-)
MCGLSNALTATSTSGTAARGSKAATSVLASLAKETSNSCPPTTPSSSSSPPTSFPLADTSPSRCPKASTQSTTTVALLATCGAPSSFASPSAPTFFSAGDRIADSPGSQTYCTMFRNNPAWTLSTTCGSTRSLWMWVNREKEWAILCESAADFFACSFCSRTVTRVGKNFWYSSKGNRENIALIISKAVDSSRLIWRTNWTRAKICSMLPINGSRIWTCLWK